jgi:hypothetical protein
MHRTHHKNTSVPERESGIRLVDVGRARYGARALSMVCRVLSRPLKARTGHGGAVEMVARPATVRARSRSDRIVASARAAPPGIGLRLVHRQEGGVRLK